MTDPQKKKQAADEAHAAFIDSRSDFLSYLRLWRYYEQARSDHSRNKLTRVLRKQFLSPNRMREWSDVYRQLKEMVASAGSHRSKKRKRSIGTIQYSNDQTRIVDDDRYAAIHQSLMTGLLSGIAMAGEKNEYNGAGGLKLFLWPGSGVSNTKPKWVIAGELVETSRQFARTVARIDPHGLRRSLVIYSNALIRIRTGVRNPGARFATKTCSCSDYPSSPDAVFRCHRWIPSPLAL